MSLEHTLFLDFLKLFVNMRLVVSFAGKQKTHYLDLRIKSYGCLKFQGEVWAGRACAAANEEELTACAKFCGQGGWARGAGVDKVGHPRWGGRRRAVGDSGSPGTGDRQSGSGRPSTRRPLPSVGGDRRSAAGRGSQPVQATTVDVAPFFLNFFSKKKVTFFLVFFSGPCM
jgi:hypothetical protein